MQPRFYLFPSRFFRLQQEVADCQDTIDTLSKQLNQAADSDRQDVAELKSEVERLNSELSQI